MLWHAWYWLVAKNILSSHLCVCFIFIIFFVEVVESTDELVFVVAKKTPKAGQMDDMLKALNDVAVADSEFSGMQTLIFGLDPKTNYVDTIEIQVWFNNDAFDHHTQNMGQAGDDLFTAMESVDVKWWLISTFSWLRILYIQHLNIHFSCFPDMSLIFYSVKRLKFQAMPYRYDLLMCTWFFNIHCLLV